MNNQTLTLLGRATADAEYLTSKAGQKFGKFSVAINEYRGPDRDEATNFYEVLGFAKQPQSRIGKIKKGTVVMVQGRPQIDTYQNKDGEFKAQIKCNASHIDVFDPPRYSKPTESDDVIEVLAN